MKFSCVQFFPNLNFFCAHILSNEKVSSYCSEVKHKMLSWLIYDSIGSYSRYIYMYYLTKIPITREYPLHYSMQHLVKRSHRDHLNRAHLWAAREHVSIMLDRRITVVIYDRLHLHPHGDDTTKDFEQHHSKLKSAGILSKIVSLSEDYFHGEDLVVYREGNEQLSSF